MSNKLFNSSFEMQWRALLLLSVGCGKAYSVDRIVGLDFITCYSADFKIPFGNLHGKNSYKYGEISNRRLLMQEAIKGLVMQNLVEVTLDRGYLFSVSQQGDEYIKRFESDYATQYREIAKAAVKKYKNDSDHDIFSLIQNTSLISVRGSI